MGRSCLSYILQTVPCSFWWCHTYLSLESPFTLLLVSVQRFHEPALRNKLLTGYQLNIQYYPPETPAVCLYITQAIHVQKNPKFQEDKKTGQDTMVELYEPTNTPENLERPNTLPHGKAVGVPFSKRNPKRSILLYLYKLYTGGQLCGCVNTECIVL